MPAPTTRSDPIWAASSALAAGTTTPRSPARAAAIATERMPGRGKELAFERELARERVAHDRRRGHLARRREYPDRDRQVEPGSVLAEARRSEVDDHAAERPLESGALDGRTHAVARVVHRRAGETGEDERRESATDVRLDGHEVPADAQHRDPHDPPVHAEER